MKILILCTGNSCRSQMAEGFLTKLTPDSVEVYSAGIEAHGMNPKAMKVMEEAGVSIAKQQSEKLDKYLDTKFDYIITVCDNANERCPYFPGEGKRIHHSFNDPASAIGTEEQQLPTYRKVRDEVELYCKDFANQLLGF